MKNNIIKSLKNGIIVSCQSEGEDPFNHPEYVALFAKAAEMGGAIGIRTEGIEKLKAIKKSTNLPVIGLVKSKYEDGYVKITGSVKDVESLIEAGTDIVAIDGTFRKREGMTGPEMIRQIKNKYGCLVLADIATFDEALACESAGADCISTTLNGYTPYCQAIDNRPDFDLIEKLAKVLNIPLFAEGRINTPKDASIAMDLGAYAVIVGTAITRPRVITQWYVKAINTYTNGNKN